jgi:hypothetical protein
MTVRHGSPEARQPAEAADVYRELAADPRVPAHLKYAALNTIGVAYLRAERYELASKAIQEGIAANNGKAGTLDQIAMVTSAFCQGRESDVAAGIGDLEAATSTREFCWTEELATRLLLDELKQRVCQREPAQSL